MKYKKRIKQNKDRKLHLRKLSFKEKQKSRRIAKGSSSKKEKVKQRLYHDIHGDYKKVKPPEIFSLVTNAEQTIAFINRIKKVYDDRKKLFVILKDVKVIEYDAIVLLLSILIKFKSKGIYFNGDFPDNEKAGRILLNSGFFSYLSDEIPDQERYDLKREGRILTHAQKKVDSELTDAVISECTTWVWNKNRRCTGMQRALIELMHNTNNHAAQKGEGEKHWWLTVQRRKKDNTACFSFIDFGVGIFESLYSKEKDSKWYEWRRPLAKLFNFDDDHKELLKLILNGTLHRTVTGKPFRGKGLPGIYSAYKRKDFKKLHIISNGVYADIENENFLSLKNSFSGTFVYWELTVDNNNIDATYED